MQGACRCHYSGLLEEPSIPAICETATGSANLDQQDLVGSKDLSSRVNSGTLPTPYFISLCSLVLPTHLFVHVPCVHLCRLPFASIHTLAILKHPVRKGTRVYAVIRVITAVLRVFHAYFHACSRVKSRKYRQNTRGRRALTAIRCVNECN